MEGQCWDDKCWSFTRPSQVHQGISKEWEQPGPDLVPARHGAAGDVLLCRGLAGGQMGCPSEAWEAVEEVQERGRPEAVFVVGYCLL